MKRNLLTLGVFATSALIASSAFAGQATTTMDVGLDFVADTCTIDPISSVDFGTVISSDVVTQQISVVVTCASGLPYKVGMDAGLNGGFGGIRNLEGVLGATTVYALYQINKGNSDVDGPWGDADLSLSTAAVNGDAIPGTGTGSPQSHDGFVKFDATVQPQTLEQATYTDTVNVIVEW